MRYFPASGFRWRDIGALNMSTGEGDSWCSSPLGIGLIDGGYLYLRDEWARVCYGASRSYAIPVRCVQELTFKVSLSPEYC